MTSPGQAARPVIELAEKSDPGRDPTKQVNEDACAYRETRSGHLLVVCDGMGGHQAGREASNLAVQTILAMVEGAPDGLSSGQVLKSAIEQAGRAVFQLGGPGKSFVRPGSTVVALLIHPGGTEVAHVGDSRAYCIRGGSIHPLTRDHSMVQQMIDAGFLRPDEAYGHPDGNKITRALGLLENTDVELRPEPLAQEAGDIFLLATDGLFDVMRPEEALELVLASEEDLEEAADKLVELANARGGPDNITVQLARILEAGLRIPLDFPGVTQLSGSALDAHPLEGRSTILEVPAPHASPRATLPFAPNETRSLGAVPTWVAGNATLLEEAPLTQRAPIPPTQADEPMVEAPAKPNERGGIYLVLGMGVVCLIITAVSMWWLVARKPTPPLDATLDPEPLPTASPPPLDEPTSPLAPAPSASERPPHRHRPPWSQGYWQYRQPEEVDAPTPSSSSPPSP